MDQDLTYEELVLRVKKLEEEISRLNQVHNQSIEALAKSEEKFRLIAETGIGDIWELDMEGRVTFSSPAKKRIFGYDDEEARDMTFENFIAPEKLDDVIVACQSTLEKLKSNLVETIGIKKDGSRVPLEVAISPIIKNNELIGIQGITRDITDRKRAERERKESEERYRMIAENTSDAIRILDLSSMRLSYISPSYKSIMGFTPEEHLKRPLEEVFHPDSFNNIMKVLSEELQRDKEMREGGRVTRRLEWREVHKDGHYVWVESEMSFLRDDQENAVGVIGISRDISERKKAEENLKNRNKFIETILEHLPIGLAVNKISEKSIPFVNRKFEEIYGWSTEAISDTDDFFRKVYPGQKELKEKIIADMLSGDPDRMQWNNLMARGMDGSRRVVSAMNIPLFEQDLMISTVRDETARFQAINELKESEERFKIPFRRPLIPSSFTPKGATLSLSTAHGRNCPVSAGKSSPPLPTGSMQLI